METYKTKHKGHKHDITEAERSAAGAQSARDENLRLEGKRTVTIINEHRRDADKWRVDRKIPVAVILTLCLQTIMFAVFITRLDSRVTMLETTNSTNAWQSERIIRMDERLSSLQLDMSEIKRILQQPQAKR